MDDKIERWMKIKNKKKDEINDKLKTFMQTKMGVAQKSSVTTGRSKVIDYTIPLNANMAPTDSCD